MGVETPRGKFRISQNPPVKRDGSLNPLDYEHLQRSLHAPNGLGAVAAGYFWYRELSGKKHGTPTTACSLSKR